MRCFRESPTEGAQVAALAARAGGTSVTTGRHRSEHRESQPLTRCDLVRESLDSVINREKVSAVASVTRRVQLSMSIRNSGAKTVNPRSENRNNRHPFT